MLMMLGSFLATLGQKYLLQTHRRPLLAVVRRLVPHLVVLSPVQRLKQTERRLDFMVPLSVRWLA